MSVRGEFQRILGDTTAALRVRGEHDLAESLQRAESTAGDSLEARAGAVLDGVEAASSPELSETLHHLEAICRAVVGRQRR